MSTGPVVVGLDGDASARDAVALGRRLAALLGAEVDLVTVSGPVPADALRDTAGAEDAALVVLGPTHHRSLARILRGTARRLLGAAPCPVAVAPAGYADRREAPLRRVGVAYEPTATGTEALATGHRLAARAGGSLRAIGVVPSLPPVAVDDVRDRDAYLAQERLSVQAGLERALAALPPAVPTSVDARVGDPAAELAAASRELDLLVCGSRGRGPVRAVLLGSVTERLLGAAACPVIVVPSPAQPPRRRRTMRSTVLPPPRG